MFYLCVFFLGYKIKHLHACACAHLVRVCVHVNRLVCVSLVLPSFLLVSGFCTSELRITDFSY